MARYGLLCALSPRKVPCECAFLEIEEKGFVRIHWTKPPPTPRLGRTPALLRAARSPSRQVSLERRPHNGAARPGFHTTFIHGSAQGQPCQLCVRK